MKKRKKILFVTNDTNRTGAPILFLGIIKWFSQNTDYIIHILCRNTGSLLNEFEKYGKVHYALKTGDEPKSKFEMGTVYLKRLLSDKLWKLILRPKLKRQKFDLVYCNTIANGIYFKMFASMKVPVITHIHELKRAMNNKSKELAFILKYTDHFFVPSKAVYNELVMRLNKTHMINFINETIDTTKFSAVNKQIHGRNFKEQLKIHCDSICIGACGAFNMRKGVDLFFQVAKKILTSQFSQPIHFFWIGANPLSELYLWLNNDKEKLGLHNLHFVEIIENTIDYYSMFDVFLMTSREDPSPLVNLENGAMGTPIICFDESGGTPEFLDNIPDCIIPYNDIEAMVDQLKILIFDREKRIRYGTELKQKVTENYDIEVVAPKIVSIIQKYI